MKNYTLILGLSSIPSEEVQQHLIRFLSNTQPAVLKYNPRVTSHTNQLIRYQLTNRYGTQSLSVGLLMKNLNRPLNTLMTEITSEEWGEYFKLKVGRITYHDRDWLKANIVCMIIRIDSINALVPGGVKKFNSNVNVVGKTNGRILVLAQYTPKSVSFRNIDDEILKPYGFQVRRDFVRGYCFRFPKTEDWRPIQWAVVPWLESVITPIGYFVKYRESHSENHPGNKHDKLALESK